MDEPKRLIDDTSSELELAILRAGCSVEGSSLRRVKVLGALGVGVAVASTSKVSFAMAAGWKKALVVGAIASTSAGAAIVYSVASTPVTTSAVTAAPAKAQPVAAQRAGTTPARDEETQVELPAEVQLERVRKPAEPQLEAEVAQEEATVSPQPVHHRQVRRSSSRSKLRAEDIELKQDKAPETDRVSSLQAELELLDHARSALGGGRAREALSVLGSYSSQFPGGSLGLEAEVLRIQALAASGRKSEASRRARRILGRSPNSVLAAKLRRYVID